MPYIGTTPEKTGVRHRYLFTAVGGETSISGLDDSGKSLNFTDAEYIDVYLNGVLLQAGEDYSAQNNTINGLSALALNDVIEVTVFDIFNLAKINSEAIRTRHYFTASGGETSIGTSQIAGLTISANEEIEVSLNGVSLVQGSDFNTTTANTIGGLSALSANDVVAIVLYQKFVLTDTVSKAVGGTFNGPVAFGGQTTFSGDVTGAVQEYFLVDLTTNQTGISSEAEATVDFGGSGTVRHDTKSNFDTSNDAYLLDNSNGLYLISFGCAICSDGINTEDLEDVGCQIEVATDGSTFTGLFGASFRPNDDQNENQGSAHLSGTYVYKATTATTKLRMRVIADTDAGNYEVRGTVNSNMHSLTFSTATAHGTYLNVVRIA